MKKHITPEEWNDNIFHAVGKDWALLSAYDPNRVSEGNGKNPNEIGTMTVSWGGVGVLWGKNVFFCFVRPQRYTKEFIDAQDTVTLSLFDPERYRGALKLCGTVSGREHDKIAEAGLTARVEKAASNEHGAVVFDEARVTVIGKKLFAQEISKDGFFDRSILAACYPNNDFHTVYVCEIVDITVEE